MSVRYGGAGNDGHGGSAAGSDGGSDGDGGSDVEGVLGSMEMAFNVPEKEEIN